MAKSLKVRNAGLKIPPLLVFPVPPPSVYFLYSSQSKHIIINNIISLFQNSIMLQLYPRVKVFKWLWRPYMTCQPLSFLNYFLSFCFHPLRLQWFLPVFSLHQFFLCLECTSPRYVNGPPLHFLLESSQISLYWFPWTRVTTLHLGWILSPRKGFKFLP